MVWAETLQLAAPCSDPAVFWARGGSRSPSAAWPQRLNPLRRMSVIWPRVSVTSYLLPGGPVSDTAWKRPPRECSCTDSRTWRSTEHLDAHWIQGFGSWASHPRKSYDYVLKEKGIRCDWGIVFLRVLKPVPGGILGENPGTHRAEENASVHPADSWVEMT